MLNIYTFIYFFTKMTPNHSEVRHALVHSFPRQNEVSLAGPFELQKSLQFTFWMLFSFQIYFRIFSRKFCYQNILYQSSKHVLKYESLPQLRSRSVSSTKADCSLISARTARSTPPLYGCVDWLSILIGCFPYLLPCLKGGWDFN